MLIVSLTHGPHMQMFQFFIGIFTNIQEVQTNGGVSKIEKLAYSFFYQIIHFPLLSIFNRNRYLTSRLMYKISTYFQWFHKQDIDHLKREKRKNMGSHYIVNYEERI